MARFRRTGGKEKARRGAASSRRLGCCRNQVRSRSRSKRRSGCEESNASGRAMPPMLSLLLAVAALQIGQASAEEEAEWDTPPGKLSWDPPLAADGVGAQLQHPSPLPPPPPPLPPPPPQPAAAAAAGAAAAGCDARPWLAGVSGFDGSPRSFAALGSVSRGHVASCGMLTANKHPHLQESSPVALINPLWLMTASRFDLVAKYIYLRDRSLGRHSKWGLRLYAAHIAAFNGFQESDPPQPPKTSLLQLHRHPPPQLDVQGHF